MRSKRVAKKYQITAPEYDFYPKKEPYVDIITILLLVILNSILIALLLYWLYRSKSYFKNLPQKQEP